MDPVRQTTVKLGEVDRVAVRVVVSPYATMAASIIEVLHGLSRGSPASWHRFVRERAGQLDLAPLAVFAAHTPDFLSSAPRGPRVTIEEELASLRATSDETVRDDITREFGADVPAEYDWFMRHPRRSIEQLADALAAYWAAVIKPLWPLMEALLDREVLRIGQALATEGPSALLARISHRFELRDDALVWSVRPDGSRGSPGDEPDLRGRMLLLIPMCCGPDAIWTNRSRDEVVTIAYSTPGVGLLWEQADGQAVTDSMEELFGGTRARVLRAALTPATTADLATELDLSAALVSHHLKMLRGLGLVDGVRFGHRVYYRMTTRGRNLWSAMES